MNNLKEFNYKRGTQTYTINGIDYTDKVLNVFLHGKFVCYIKKCIVLNEYFAWKNENSDYICAGLTLKECKEVLNTSINKNFYY